MDTPETQIPFKDRDGTVLGHCHNFRTNERGETVCDIMLNRAGIASPLGDPSVVLGAVADAISRGRLADALTAYFDHIGDHGRPPDEIPAIVVDGGK